MTREEAARILYREKSNVGAMRWGKFPVNPEHEKAYKTYIEAVDLALDALVLAPDPDTGPEGSIRKREKMRSVKKETMDELARITRKYWATGDKDILDAKRRKAFELSEQAYGSDAKWLQFCDLLDGAVRFNRNVSNDIIYKIFGLLCIEVSAPVDDEK